MAQGGGMPQMPQAMPQGGTQPQAQVAPGQAQTSDPRAVIEALKAALPQVTDPQGYVNLKNLILLWPQIAQKFGINIPFETVLQMIKQNPEMLDDIITQLGLAGIDLNGRKIPASQLVGIASGAVAGGI